MNEEQLENLCLDWFQEGGWDVLHGPDIAPDSDNPLRNDYAQVVLDGQLRAAFETINKHLPAVQIEHCYEQFKAIILKPESLDLITNNRAFHRLLLEGVPVEYKKDDGESSTGGETVSDHAFIIDFDNLNNNTFSVVNQFTITGTKQPRRPDVICFINGLPIVVLELKSPSDENADIWDAFNQLQTYKDEVSDLFIFNEALVVSDGYTCLLYTSPSPRDRG